MAVIIILSAVLLLTVSSFTKTIANSKTKAYQIQIRKFVRVFWHKARDGLLPW
jgi:type II secretory pathway pseudopilin PulG